jgi:hypothetical protein
MYSNPLLNPNMTFYLKAVLMDKLIDVCVRQKIELVVNKAQRDDVDGANDSIEGNTWCCIAHQYHTCL